jgi:hypothetical protein
MEHPMELALKDALVGSLENDPEAERILYIALKHFIRWHDRETKKKKCIFCYTGLNPG